MTENFIRIYDDILPNRLIEDFTSMANQTVTWNNRNDVDKSDFQVPLDPFWPALVKEANESLLNRGLVSYLNDFPYFCLLYTSPSPRDQSGSRMPSSA